MSCFVNNFYKIVKWFGFFKSVYYYSLFLFYFSEFGYVRKHAAQSLLKLLLFKHLPIPELLTEYIQENENNLNTNIELYLRRRCIADVTDLTENDILIT